MKLISKLTLFITLSKLVIVFLFVLILPVLIESIASGYTNSYLRQQKSKVLGAVARNGIDFYLQGEGSYGSYTMLKEEYISLEPYTKRKLDTIETAQRLVEQDTLNYRILSYTFKAGNNTYLLEIGKKTETISQYNRPLQRIALYVLIGLIGFTVLADLLFTRFLLRPLGHIIETKLVYQKFPFAEGVPSVNTSTTDFKELDNALISLMDQVNTAFRKEREFTANASHELMTPISILKSKLENLMLNDDVTEELQRRLAEMMSTVNRLSKIVNSLLLISRIENEQFEKRETVNLKILICEVLAEVEHRLEEKNISLSFAISEDRIVKGVNRDLFFQCFYNLLNNAIKYNRQGGSISISDHCKQTVYCITIADEGLGISQADLPLIFNRFKKANKLDRGGYGLGLAIVKSICDYHGTRIEVESKLNEGSVFSLIFPLESLNQNAMPGAK